MRVMLVALALSVLAAGNADPGVEFVLKVEARWVGNGDVEAPMPQSLRRSLPDGSAEWRITTNGTSFRSLLSGRYLDLPSGVTILQKEGESRRFVLNPDERTFEVRRSSERSLTEEDALTEVSVTPEAVTIEIAGFRAHKVVVLFRRALPPGVRGPDGAGYARAEIVNWCVVDVGLPRVLAKAIDRRVQAFTPRIVAEQYQKTCPVALQSSYRLFSFTPDHATVLTIKSIKRVSVGAERFEVPADYKNLSPGIDRERHE